VAVKVGDRVTKGQEVGRLGNSGSTTAPHLHFHVMSSTQPLTATNLPFEIEAFDLQGTAEESGFVPAPDAGPRTDELPLIESVVRFP
jgi:murein DD-endopeptidase MepM/ murein hydrolase activator NlpD